MRWTTRMPTELGFYWVECIGPTSGQLFHRVANVDTNAHSGVGPANRIYLDGENYDMERPPSHVKRWGDRPIEMPQP